MAGQEVFIRRASGLTRVISPWDALIYSTTNPGPVYAFLYIVWMPGLFPGGDLSVASYTLVLLLPIMALYYLFSVSMPRSGGEYLYVSRTLSPAWGYFANWALTIIGISWTGQIQMWGVNWGIADFFYANGVLNGDKSWIDLGLRLHNASDLLAFGIGFFTLILNFLVLWRGAKATMRWSWIAQTMSWIGLAVIVYVSATSSQQIFAQRLHDLAGLDYQKVLSDASTAGANLTTTSWYATTMAGMTYINLNSLGNTYTTNCSGEIKQVNKALPLAMFGSMFLFAIYWFTFYAVEWIFPPGKDWWNAIGYMTIAGNSPMPIFPVASTMTLYLTSNPVLINLAILAFIFGNYGGTVGLSFGPIRNIFAWSFDRIIPTGFAKVDRRGSPYAAVLLTFVLAFVFLVIYSFTGWLQYIIFTITVWFLGWIVVGIAGILFPYRRRDIFEKSPDAVKKKIAGIPVISIMGLLTTIVSIVTVYFTTVPSLTGAASAINLGTTCLVLAVVPFIVFYVSYYTRKSKGIAMDLQFKEIPPD